LYLQLLEVIVALALQLCLKGWLACWWRA